MGYTHHWTRPREFDRDVFAEWVDDVHAIVRAAGVQIRGWDGQGEPGFTRDDVRFNGDAARDEDGETFAMPRVAKEAADWWKPLIVPPHETRAFCKTAYRPYDVVVTAALIALADRFRDVCISSDGELAEWEPGLRLLLGIRPVSRFRLGCRHEAARPLEVAAWRQ
jgi:hypothetical protein